MTIQKR